MSIQWTFIAGFLYFEVAVVVLMILPIFSPRRWHQFFKSRLFVILREYTSFYFYGFLGILCLFLIDAIREMRKYSHSTDGSHTNLAGEMKGSVKLFRAQRNFYITAFAIFLAFVIRRIVKMLIIQDELTLKAEKIINKAENTVKHAKDTILANTTQADANDIKNELEIIKAALEEEKCTVNKWRKEAEIWKKKYEEVVPTELGDK